MRQSKSAVQRSSSAQFVESAVEENSSSPAGETVISLRQQSKIESRRKLLAAARRLFTSKGYEDTRPQDIAKEAGVGYGTFYLHFTDKHECFLAFVDDVEWELMTVSLWFWPEDDSSPETFLPPQVRLLFDYAELNPNVMRLALMDARVLSTVKDGRRPFGEEQMLDLLTRWQQGGKVSASFDVPLLTHLMLSAVKAAEAMVSRSPADREAMVANLNRFLINAIKP